MIYSGEDEKVKVSTSVVDVVKTSTEIKEKLKRKIDNMETLETKKKKRLISKDYADRLYEVIKNPTLNNLYGIIGNPAFRDLSKVSKLTEQQINYVKQLKAKVGEQQLNIFELQFMLFVYDYENIYTTQIDNKFSYTVNKDQDIYIIKLSSKFYAFKVTSSKCIYFYNKDDKDREEIINSIIYLGYGGYKIIFKKINSNFKEASDIISLIIFMVLIRKSSDDILMYDINVKLMCELFKEYINTLLISNSSLLYHTFLRVQQLNQSNPVVKYEETVEYNQLNFVQKCAKIYNYKIRFYGKECATNKEICDRLAYNISKQYKLSTTEFLILLYLIRNDLDNVIDPIIMTDTIISKKQADRKAILDDGVINKTGKFYFPICREEHWTLWVVDIKEKDIKLLLYDSLNSKFTNSRDGMVLIEDILSFFNTKLRKEIATVQLPANLKQGRNNSCGYYALFYLISLLKFNSIENVPDIETFDIDVFILDLKNGLTSLDNKEKAAIVSMANRGLFLYQFKKNKQAKRRNE